MLPVRHPETVKNHHQLSASLLTTEQQVSSLATLWTEQGQGTVQCSKN